MDIITLDMETYYDQQYSLSKLTTEEYIRSDLFEVIGVAAQVNDGKPEWFSGTHEEVGNWCRQFDWANAMLVAHNAMFDAAILSWRFDIRPKVIADTLSMSRAVHGMEVGLSLEKLAGYYGLGIKGTEVINARSKRRLDFSPDELARYAEYCRNDVALTYGLFQILIDIYPRDELRLIDQTLKMFTEPVLELDAFLLEKHLSDVQARKEELLANLGGDPESVRKRIMSNPQFAELLQEHGVIPPTKISPTTGKTTYAFAKTDEGMKELLAHPNPEVQALVSARLGVKSTLEETRTQRFLGIAQRGNLPVPLKYYGAPTARWAGLDKVNLQNLPSRGADAGALKHAIKPPPGYVIVDADSSQIEARILAWLSEQEDLVEAFRTGQDVYKIMASAIYRKPAEEISSSERFIGKSTLLGSGYGMGAKKFQLFMQMANVEMSFDEAKHIIDTYRETYPRVPALWAQGDAALRAMVDSRSAPYGREGVMQINGLLGVLGPNGIPRRYHELRRTRDAKGNEAIVYTSRTGVTGIWGGKFTENCLAAGTEVLTSRGWVPIEAVRLEDKVHDGVEWVSHGGSVFKSVQYCVIVDGVYMTPDHEVLTDDGWKKAEALPEPYRPDLWGIDCYQSGEKRREALAVEVSLPMRDICHTQGEGSSTVRSEGMDAELRMPDQISTSEAPHYSRHESAPRVRGMEVYGGPVSATLTSGVEELRGAGNKGMRALGEVVSEFLGRHGADVSKRVGSGSARQQQRVFSGELPLGISSGEFAQQTQFSESGHHGTKQDNGDRSVHSILPSRPRPTANCTGQEAQVYPVFDIINSGPRHRFVVRGKLGPFVVHNCCQYLARVVIGQQMLRIAKRYRVVLTVHDAIACIAPEEEAQEAQAYVESCMRWVPEWAPGLPLNCESGMGRSYGEC